MKYLVVFALIAAVASAAVVKPVPLSAEIQEIIAAIQSPSTHPATAAALEQMLHDILGIKPPVAPIVVNPIGEEEPAVEPTPVIVAPGPSVVAPAPAASSPLVQIVVNVNAGQSPVAVGPVVAPELVEPSPVHVVDVAPEPVQVVEVAPTPVQIIESNPAPAEPISIGTPVLPIQIIETNPAPAEPISIGTPVLPIQIIETNPAPVEPISIDTPVLPAIILPEELN